MTLRVWKGKIGIRRGTLIGVVVPLIQTFRSYFIMADRRSQTFSNPSSSIPSKINKDVKMSKLFTRDQLRASAYRAVIPMSVLLDMSLSVNAIRLYGMIEQMLSNTGEVYFSLKYIGSLFNLEIRQVKYIAKELKDAGYLERKQINSTKWLWTLKRGEVIQEEEGEETPLHPSSGVQPNCTPGVQSECTPGVQPNCPHKYHHINTKNINHNNGVFTEEEIKDLKLLRFGMRPDIDDDDFMVLCEKIYKENDPKFGHQARINGIRAMIKKGMRGSRWEIASKTSPNAPGAANSSGYAYHGEGPRYHSQAANNASYPLYCSSFLRNRALGLFIADSEALSLEEWKAAGSPAIDPRKEIINS